MRRSRVLAAVKSELEGHGSANKKGREASSLSSLIFPLATRCRAYLAAFFADGGGVPPSSAVPAPKVSIVAGSGTSWNVRLVDADLPGGVDREDLAVRHERVENVRGRQAGESRIELRLNRWTISPAPRWDRPRVPRKFMMTVVPSCPGRTGTANPSPATHSVAAGSATPVRSSRSCRG